MDKIIKVFILCFFAGILFACSDDDTVKVSTDPYFGVAGESLTQTFTGDKETRYVTVNTNQPFTVTSSDPSWCTVEIVDDKVDNLKITINKNGQASERTARITVSATGFDDVVIHVTQAWTPSISADKPYLLLNNENLEFTLKITSNVDYEMELPDWVMKKGSQPDGTYSFELNAISPGERMGNIIIKAKDENFTTKVTVPVIHRERIKKIASWLFDDPSDLTKPTVGKALEMVRNVAYNPDAQFTSVNGPTVSNKAVRIPLNCHFVADHGIIPKEGENNISEYTLFFEFKIPAIGRFYSFFQTALNNEGDGEIFIRSTDPATIGVGPTGYAGDVKPGKWYRLYLSFKPGDVKFFMNGELFHTSTTADTRFRLDSAGVILCGGPWAKKDDNEFDVAEISIWNGALTEQDMKELEGVE